VTPFELPATVEPEEWTVVFHTKASSWWFNFIALGRFKHVSAFAYLPGLQGWVIHDWQHGGLRVAVLPHSDGACRLIRSMFGPDTKWVEVRRRAGPASRFGFRLGSCVGAVKHLLGIPGHALRPDALYRYLVRHGKRVNSAIPAAGGRPGISGAQAAG
jgi:hypothetical protein